MELLLKLLPTAGTLVFVIVALILADRLLEKASKGTSRLRDQLLMLALTAIGILAVVLALPISNELRGQILSLIGIVLTAAIALSSTTFLGNAMGGIMLNAVRSFRIGDFIEVKDTFGRVTERGLFHTEVQTRERDLITLPNLYLVTHPVRTVRTSGTIISASVSIGYDAPHDDVEENLLIGAEKAGLKEPFVQITELGDFSVVYRISGLLEEIKQIMTAPSRLRAKVLDALHEAKIEIVSPTFMNQRVFNEGHTFIPEVNQSAPDSSEEDSSSGGAGAAESLAFDKAEKAESIASLKERETKLKEQIFEAEEGLKKASEEEKEQINENMAGLKTKLDRVQKVITVREERMENEE